MGCEFKTSRPAALKGFECSVNEFCVDSGRTSSYVAKGNLFEIRASPVHGLIHVTYGPTFEDYSRHGSVY